MLKFNKEVVKKIMMKENGYSNEKADNEVDSLGELDARLQPVLDEYIENRIISADFAVEGLTTKMIMDKYEFNFWLGLNFMEGYIKYPEKAKRTRKDLTPIRYHSLAKGVH